MSFKYRLVCIVSIPYRNHGTQLIGWLHRFLSNRNSNNVYNPSLKKNLEKSKSNFCSLELQFCKLINLHHVYMSQIDNVYIIKCDYPAADLWPCGLMVEQLW